VKHEPRGGYGLKVGLGDPSVPVVLQDGQGIGGELTERPLVYDTRIPRVVEEAGCDPRLEHEPSTEVDTAHLGGPIGKTRRDGVVSRGGGDSRAGTD